MNSNNLISRNFTAIAILLAIAVFLGCTPKKNTNVFTDPGNHPVESGLLLLAVSTGYTDFKTERTINATPARIFSIITDYEKYPLYFPDLHDKIEIISQTKTGQGVVWKNTGTYKGKSFTSTWKVTEYLVNEKVVMQDTEGEGKVTLSIAAATSGQTRYIYDGHLFMFLPVKNEFFVILEKEADSVKIYSEKQ